MKLLFTFLCIICWSQSFAVEAFLRAGDAPETGEIYRNQESGHYVDASSLPFTYRSRITKNTEAFEKIDMNDIAGGRQVSSTGVISYAQEWHARAEDVLLHDTQANRYLVVASLSQDDLAAFKDNTRFKQIEARDWGIFDTDKDSTESKIMSDLDKLLGIPLKYAALASSTELSEAYSRFLESKEKALSRVTDLIDGEIAKATKRGNLVELTQWTASRSALLADTLTSDMVEDRGLKKKLALAEKAIRKENAHLIKIVQDSIRDLVKQQKVGEATVLEQWIKGHTSGEVEENHCSVIFKYRGVASVKALTDNMVYLSNRGYTLGSLPAHLKDLKFTKLQGSDVHGVTIVARKGGKCYLLIDARYGDAVIEKIIKDGWSADGSIAANDPMGSFKVYSKNMKRRETVDIPETSGGWISVVVAAPEIEIKK